MSDETAEQARDWIVHLASGTMSAAKMRDFEHWLAQPGHRPVFEHERLLWRSLGPAPDASVATAAMRRGRSRRVRWTRRLSLAAVALLVLMLAMPELRLRLQADHRTDTVVQSVRLPDGSRMVLDAGSAVAVRYTAQTRRVELLRGRAWFEVAAQPGAPFQVAAQGGLVEDISTAFAVASEAGQVLATVEQGRVRVAASMDGEWLELAKGQQAVYAAGGPVVRLDDLPPDRIAAWRQGELLLDATAVAEAIEQIARYRRGPTFVRGDFSRLPEVNAAFHVDRPEEALDALASISGLAVTRLPLGVAIVRPVPPR